jgi:hypothetical protein
MSAIAGWVPGRWPEGKERPDSKKLGKIHEALCRLPTNLDNPNLMAWGIAWGIYEAAVDDRSLLNEVTTSPNMYKPRAWVTTFVCFVGWYAMTGRVPTRVTKRVEGRLGVQEAGEFVVFLAEVFRILGIKASAAGQFRAMKQELRGPAKIP